MIIEVNDQTGEATTYKSINHFVSNHYDELNKTFESKFKTTPEIDIFPQQLELIQGLLPSGTSKIIRIHSHISDIVVNCENGEGFALNRIGKYPYFKLHDPFGKYSKTADQ